MRVVKPKRPAPAARASSGRTSPVRCASCAAVARRNCGPRLASKPAARRGFPMHRIRDLRMADSACSIRVAASLSHCARSAGVRSRLAKNAACALSAASAMTPASHSAISPMIVSSMGETSCEALQLDSRVSPPIHGFSRRGSMCSSRFQMCIAVLVEFVIGITHGLGPRPSEHHLEINGFETLVLVAVNDAGRAGDAFPWSEDPADAISGLILDEHHQISTQYEENFLHFMGVGSVSLTGRHKHDAERKAARRDYVRIGMFARPAGADETVLRPAIPFDFCVLERRPVAVLFTEAANMGAHDFFQRCPFQFRRALMPRYRHGSPF